MKADWTDDTDLHTCLCCGQPLVAGPGKRITPDRAAVAMTWFEALGFTRESLLTKHRKQLEYQSPGFVEWLEGH